MFSFLKSLGQPSRRHPSPRSSRSSRRLFFDQLGGGLFEPSCGRRPESLKPAVEALEERRLMSIVVGGLSGSLNVGGAPQPLSNMSSTTDAFFNTFFFQISADHTLSYTSSSVPNGTRADTGVQANSISAGTVDGYAVVGVIKPDQSIWLYTPGEPFYSSSAQWTYLGGKALSIGVTNDDRGGLGGLGQVYVIGTDYNLYVQDSLSPHGWVCLGAPSLNGQHVSLETISALAYTDNHYGDHSVCYAVDSVGDVWQCTLQDPYNLSRNGTSGGIWSNLGGTNTVQIAASFDANHIPIVYALSYNQFNNVSVFDGGWTNLGGDALEISAARSDYSCTACHNTVFAIMDNHQVSVLNNSAFSDWTHVNTNYGPIWQSLGGYATAITAEAADVVYASDANNYAYVYNNGWVELSMRPMNPSYSPLSYQSFPLTIVLVS
jgi:hypothetical protein